VENQAGLEDAPRDKPAIVEKINLNLLFRRPLSLQSCLDPQSNSPRLLLQGLFPRFSRRAPRQNMHGYQLDQMGLDAKGRHYHN
jgi:hypothetical protein